jgi:N utilization substance protein B
MKPRHVAREVALQILYRFDVNHQNNGAEIPTGIPLSRELQNHFEHFQVPQNAREFTSQLVVGTVSELKSLDELLEKHASHWKVSRMPLIDRNLLRMATYELLHFPEIPTSVTLDEAIELAKQFGTADSSAFINGVLDALKGALKIEKSSTGQQS